MKSIDPLILAIPGDLHLTERGLENYRAAQWAIEQFNCLIRPDRVVFIGDNVQDATEAQFDLFQEIIEPLESPFHVLVGDHDVTANKESARFLTRWGITYGEEIVKGYQLYFLNTQEGKPVGMSKDQLVWFEQSLNEASSDPFKTIWFQHNYPYQIWEDFAGPGIEDWRRLAFQARPEAIFSGHTHYLQMANDGRNLHVATRSIGDPEGGRPGFLLVYLHGNDLALAYRTVDDSGPIVLITHPRDELLARDARHIVSEDDRIQARIWSNSQVTHVEAQIDQGSWFSMFSMPPSLEYQNISNDQSFCDWRAPLNPHFLHKGIHSITVRAETENRESGSQTIEIMVDSTYRFNPIPRVRPMVHSTKFC